MTGKVNTSQRAPQTVWTWLRSLARILLVYAVILPLAIPPSYLISAWIYTPTANAAAYSNGYGKYLNRDFAGAKASLKSALQTRMSKSEQARTTQLLGMSHFMLGDKAGAAKAFKAALAIDPTLAITQADALNPQMQPFFKSLKGTGGGRAPTAAAKAPSQRPPGGSKLAASAPGEKPAPSAKGGKPGNAPPPRGKPSGPRTTDSSGAPLKQTFLTVTSTTKGANVTIDGIIAGPVNSQINTDPGKVLIEVAMTGYITKKVNVLIAKNKSNNITVDLEKPKPKPQPKPIAPPQRAAPPQQQQRQADMVSNKPQADYYGAAVGAPPATAAGKKKGKGAARGGTAKPYAPAPSDDMFGGASATGPSGAPPPGPDLTAQFAADAAAARQPQQQMAQRPQQFQQQQPQFQQQQPQFQQQPQQFQQQPQQFQQQPQQFQQQPQQFQQQPQQFQQQYQQPPQYAPTPQYYAPPPPQYYAPPPQPYYAPPPDPIMSEMQSAPAAPLPPPVAPPPQADPADTGFDADSEPAALKAPSRTQGRAPGPSNSRKNRSSKAKGGDFKFLFAILPFGAGQFYNGRTLLGLGFMAAEGGAIGFYFYNSQQNTKTVKDADTYNATYCNGQASPPPECDVNYKYTTAKAKAYSQNANYSLMGFGVVYAISAIQAMIDDGPAPEKKKRRRSKGMNFGDDYREHASEEELADAGEAPVDLHSFQWQLDPTPVYDQGHQRTRSALSLNLTWTF